jgi:glutathione S-transferase
MEGKSWSQGERFTLADCAAAPALLSADLVVPLGPAEKNLSAYLNRLMARPSCARALKEAEPYLPLFPLEPKPRIKRGRGSRPAGRLTHCSA